MCKDKPTTPEQGTMGDFEISVDLTFEDSEATVDVPVDGSGTDNGATTPGGGSEEKPGQGGNTGGGSVGEDNDDDASDTAITISDNGTGYLTNGVDVPQGGPYPTDVAVVMNVPNGIKNMYVKVVTTNDTFKGMVGEMGLTTGDGMDLAGEGTSELESLFPLPESGATDYTFTMSETLFGLLGNFAGKHDFTLTIVDAKGEQESATLTINI